MKIFEPFFTFNLTFSRSFVCHNFSFAKLTRKTFQLKTFFTPDLDGSLSKGLWKFSSFPGRFGCWKTAVKSTFHKFGWLFPFFTPFMVKSSFFPENRNQQKSTKLLRKLRKICLLLMISEREFSGLEIVSFRFSIRRKHECSRRRDAALSRIFCVPFQLLRPENFALKFPFATNTKAVNYWSNFLCTFFCMPGE